MVPRLFYHFKQVQEGQGLLELTIALGIVMTGVIAALSLSLSNTQASRQSENRVIASSLAREGIEAARFKREEGWVRNTPTDTSFLSTFPVPGMYAIFFDPQATDNQFIWSFVPLTGSDPFTDNKTIMRQLDTVASPCKDLMIQGFGTGNTTPVCAVGVNQWRVTTFRRVIELQALITDSLGVSGAQGYRVLSTVQWQTGAEKKQTITVEDLLYDWRK